jgi:hypothetical protein
LWTQARVPEAAPGLAISNITGTLSHGSTISISGGGFGSKGTAAPLKYDDFEAATSGSVVGGIWSVINNGSEPRYSSVVRRPNSTMSVRADFTRGAYGSNFGVSGRALPKIYLDAWYYMDAGPPYSRNHKLFRIHSGTDGQPNLFYNIYCQEIRTSILSQDGVGGGNYYQWLVPTADDFARKWVHLQGYFEESSPGTNSGTAEFWIDGEKIVSQVGNFRTRDSSSAAWNALWFGNYFGHGSEGCSTGYGDAYTYWDNVYVDTTRARVEIGDSSTYANTRRREIQLPVSWADNSISVRLNQGGFAGISGLYLYVIDSAGNASPGYRLGSVSTLPPAPTNLRVTLPG